MPAPPDLPESLPSFVARHLGEEIETGLLKPGEHLAEEAIAQRFGVSRATVRDAFRQLAREELIEHRPRRGTVVCTMSVEDLRATLELRAGLYATIIRLFTRRASDEEMAGFTKLSLRVNELAADPRTTPEAFTAATQASSLFVRERCGNPRLRTIFARMTRQSYRAYALLAHQTPQDRRSAAQFGTKLREAVRARDAEEAAVRAWRLVEANHVRMIAAFARLQTENAATGGAHQQEETWSSKTRRAQPRGAAPPPPGKRPRVPRSASRESA
jgi:DNA-binding GntR family transcriptional regulator